MKKKGLVLLSGGLDSILAVKLLQDQGVELEAINFETVFHHRRKKGSKSAAHKAAEHLRLKLKVIDITKYHLDIIRDPEHGYGSNMNPCIDCRIFAFKKAWDYAKEIKASFIATGEVLGERPMSQRRDAMMRIEKMSGLKGFIVRPLSAKALNPSIPEKEGIVDREKFLNIRGRSRKPQMELAEKFNITDYPTPAGGCLLTDPEFSKRAKDLISHNDFTEENTRLLKVGRHFRLSKRVKLIIGRNESENDRLVSMAIDNDIILDAKDIPGPIGLLRGEDITDSIIKTSCAAISRYSDSDGQETSILYWKHPQDTKNELKTLPASEKTLKNTRI